MKVFEHKLKAYNNIKEAFKYDNRTCIIHPTGTGKTYITLQLLLEHPNASIIVVTSYKSILNQLEETMNDNGYGLESFPLLDVCLYGSLGQFVNVKYDYIVLDEFHRSGAPTWGHSTNELLNNNPNAKVLGLSATPVRYLDNERDMGAELFDNNISSQLSLAECVAKEILPTPRYISCLYSMQDEYDRIDKKISSIQNKKSKTEAKMLLRNAKRLLEKSSGMGDRKSVV